MPKPSSKPAGAPPKAVRKPVVSRVSKNRYARVIREYRIQKGIDQGELAEKLGKTKNAVSNWETGRARPDLDVIGSLCALLEIPIEVFFGLPQTASLTETEARLMRCYRRITPYSQRLFRRLLQSVSETEEQTLREYIRRDFIRLPEEPLPASAGTGMSLDTELERKWLYVRVSREASRADQVIRVSGDSMQPTFQDGDVLLVQHENSLRSGEIGVFVVAGESFVKEYRADGLHSHNPKYSTIHPGEDDHARLIGRVLGVVGEDQIATPQESAILDEIFISNSDKLKKRV